MKPQAVWYSAVPKVVQRGGNVVFIPSESQRSAFALCEPGEIATGGGYIADVPVVIVESKALPANTGWNVTAHNGFGVIPTLKVSALAECLSLVP
jgi:hypothetical protein